MEIINRNRYGKLSPERLEKFENGLGVILPQDYREFLIESNGGSFTKKLFHISELQGNSLVHHVYGLHEGPEYLRLDLIKEIFGGRIPGDLLPIADDDGGNQICIGIRGKKRGNIFFWDHETGELCPLGATLGAFIDSLAEDIGDEDVLGNILNNEDVEALKELIEAGFDINGVDDNGDTLIERAAIKAKPRIIEFLAQSGAKFGRSLDFAKENAKYFEGHKEIVMLISKLHRGK